MAHYLLKVAGSLAIATSLFSLLPPVASATPATVIAQAATPAKPTVKVKRVRLNLTPAQRKQLARITEDQRRQIYAVLTPEQMARMNSPRKPLRLSQLFSSGNLSAEQKTKIKAIMESTSQKVNALLTPDQLKLMQGDR